MKILIGVCKEFFGLFVDDGSLASALLFWVAITALALPALGFSLQIQTATWVLGVFLILFENVLRSAGR